MCHCLKIWVIPINLGLDSPTEKNLASKLLNSTVSKGCLEGKWKENVDIKGVKLCIMKNNKMWLISIILR